MLNAGWPALLAALSFLLTTNLSDSIFGDVLGALQTLARAARCLALPTPRDAFLTALAKAAFPPISCPDEYLISFEKHSWHVIGGCRA